jgi:hypothetical protein
MPIAALQVLFVATERTAVPPRGGGIGPAARPRDRFGVLALALVRGDWLALAELEVVDDALGGDLADH